MSWSIQLAGKPDKIVEALTAQSAKMSGQSKVEFDEALPHLVGLVSQNFKTPEYPHGSDPFLKLDASGSGSANAEKQLQRNCSVKIEQVYGLVM